VQLRNKNHRGGFCLTSSVRNGSQVEPFPMFLLSINRETFLLSDIRDVLHHILHAAVQDFAEHVNGVGANKLVAFQAGNLTGADAVLVNQGIYCD